MSTMPRRGQTTCPPSISSERLVPSLPSRVVHCRMCRLLRPDRGGRPGPRAWADCHQGASRPALCPPRVAGHPRAMTRELETANPDEVGDRLAIAAHRLDRWGFLADPDFPDRPGPASLIVALRDVPTLRHYDPEV